MPTFSPQKGLSPMIGISPPTLWMTSQMLISQAQIRSVGPIRANDIIFQLQFTMHAQTTVTCKLLHH